VAEFVSPARFAAYKNIALGMGFVHVASGPMVRSSYHAGEFHLPTGAAQATALSADPESRPGKE
jgi:lipoic acid synthetase